jgi:hypothetical protein
MCPWRKIKIPFVVADLQHSGLEDKDTNDGSNKSSDDDKP